MTANVLYFPKGRARKPTKKVDLYDCLCLLIKDNSEIRNRKQVHLYLTWLMDELFESLSVYVNSERLKEVLLVLEKDKNKFYDDEVQLFKKTNEERCRQIVFQACDTIDDTEDCKNALGFAALILHVYRNNL